MSCLSLRDPDDNERWDEACQGVDSRVWDLKDWYAASIACQAGCGVLLVTPSMPAVSECTAASLTCPLCMLLLCLRSRGSRSSRHTWESSRMLPTMHSIRRALQKSTVLWRAGTAASGGGGRSGSRKQRRRRRPAGHLPPRRPRQRLGLWRRRRGAATQAAEGACCRRQQATCRADAGVFALSFKFL